MADPTITLRVTVDSSQAVDGAKRASTAVEGIGTSGEKAASGIDKVSKSVEGIGTSGGKAADGIDKAAQAATGMEQAGKRMAKVVDGVARGDLPAASRSMIQLAADTGSMSSKMAVLTLGMGGAALALGAFVKALVDGYREQRAFERAVISTGGVAGVTSSQIVDMAHRIGEATGQYDRATAALTRLAAGGKLTGEQMAIAGRGAVALATLAGDSAERAAAEFEKLADSPTRAVAELNEQYHFLTASVFEQIAALERAGRTTEAAEMAMRALADTSESRASTLVNNAGSIERAWNAVRDSVKDAWQAMKDIGRTDLEARLAAARKELEGFEAFQESYRRGREGGGGLDRLNYLGGSLLGSYDRSVESAAKVLERIKALEEEKAALDAAAEAQADYQRKQADAVDIQRRLGEEMLAHADKQTQLASALARTRDEFAKLREAGVTTLNGMSLDQAEIERVRQLNLEFSDTSGINARTQALQRLADFEREAYAQSGKNLKQLSELDREYWRHVDALQEIAKSGGKRIEDLRKVAAGEEALVRVQKATVAMITAENSAHAANVQAITQRVTATEALRDRLQEELDAIGQTDEARDLSNALRAAENALIKEGTDLRSPEAQAHLAEVEAIQASISARYKAIEAAREVARSWTSIWENAGNSIAQMFSDVLVRGGSLMNGLRDLAKQTVAAIIEHFARLSVINPILNAVFGRSMAAGGMSLLPTMASAAMGGGGGAIGGGGSGGFDFLSGASWVNAGKNLWSGFSAGYSSFMYGSGRVIPGAQYLGTGMYGPGMPTSWAPTGLGYAALGVGSTYAGYSRYQNTEGGLAGHAAGMTYGVGTYAIGAGLMSAAAGTGFSAGIASMGALGPIGWAAAIAMVIDMVSGGKLFGTAYRAQDIKQDIGVRPDGAYAALTMGEVRQGALFSGREWRDKALDVPPEMLEAAERFYKQIQKVMVDGARQLAIDTPEMIDATIRTQSTFDKKGNVTDTKYIVQILGREWEEASAELAATRVSAEAIVATVAASEAGHAASQIAEQWRYSAEVLMDGAQMMLAATADIERGRGLLSHGTGLDRNGGAALPDLPGGSAPGGGHDGRKPGLPGVRFAAAAGGGEVVTMSGIDNAADMLARTIALVQELAGAEESLSDAYARLMQDTDNLQMALDLMGQHLDKTSEEFVRFAVGIEEAAGGLERANSLWQTFFQMFYGESELAANQIVAMQAESSAALTAIGMDASTSMQDFRAEFEAALPSLSADDVVQWLEAASALGQFTQAQAQLEQQVLAILGPMGLAGQGLSLFGQALVGIRQQELAATDAANTLARSRGAEGASAIQLAAIKHWAMRQEAAAVRQLVAEIARLRADLYGPVPGSLDLINERIGELEGAAQSAGDGMSRAARATDDLFARWLQGVESVQQYLDSMLLGDLSALTPEEQLAEAQRQLLEMQQAAMGGDADALARLPQLADAYLRLVRGMEASGEDYTAQFDWVRDLLQATIDLPNPGRTPGAGPGAGPVQVVPSPELQALYEARDAAMAEQYAAQRAELAQQLASHLADLATLLNVPILELIEAQGVNLRDLATDLGANLADLNAASIEALGGMATTLGVPLAELVAGLDLTLPDLREGLTELTTSLGIDLTSLTGSTATQLAALAGSLGTNLKDLSEALGIDLGKLTDVNSPIFQALEANIGELSPDIKDELKPLLDAVANAAGDEQANAAVKALRDHVDALAPDIRNALGPFFDDIMPAKALDQLDYLSDIQRIARDQLDVLEAVRDNLKAANRANDIPSYDVGTPWVQGDQVAQIHHGEAVVPASVNQWLRTTGWRIGGSGASDDSRVVAELQRLNERIDRLDRNNSAGHAGTQSATRNEGERARQQRDDIARRQSQDFRRAM